MAFNADTYRLAHRPWSFTIGGRTFSAKHVSALTVMAYEGKASEAADVYKTSVQRGARAQIAALRWLLRRAFPWRASYLVRGDPVRLLLGLEPAARTEALRDFFACLQGVTSPATLPPTTTNGARSSAPTALRSP